MADELTLSVNFSVTKDGATTSVRVSDTIDVSASPRASGVQSIGTAWEAINMGEVTSPGYFFYHNLDATNYIEFSADSGGANALGKAVTNDFGCFRVTSSAIYARANTAACKLFYILCSN
jgi:hypothetical protein